VGERNRFSVFGILGRLISRQGLRALCEEGCRGYVAVMEHETLAEHIGGLASEEGLAVAVGDSWIRDNAQSLSGSARILARDDAPQPKHITTQANPTIDKSANSIGIPRLPLTTATIGSPTVTLAPASRRRASTLTTHTHMQQVAGCIHVHIRGGADKCG
jgi:hypothetical protein